MRPGLAASIPFSGVRFILYVPPVAAPVASYKDNPGWREPARQKARHRQRFCDILGLVAAPNPQLCDASPGCSEGCTHLYASREAVGDFATIVRWSYSGCPSLISTLHLR